MNKTQNQNPINSKEYKNHPFIQSLKNKERWTFSIEKKPIDIKTIFTEGRIVGATERNETCLTTFDDMHKHFTDLPNNTFFLRSFFDNYVILDVEKTCPDDLKEKFLKLPYIYGELSQSGQGYHLVFPLPKAFFESEIARKKARLQHKERFYEILQEHYVTFTGKLIEPPISPEGSFDELYEELLKDQVAPIDVEITKITQEDLKDIVASDFIIDQLKRTNIPKTLADYDNDHSRFEYAVISYLLNRLNKILTLFNVKRFGHKHTDVEKANLIYYCINDFVEHREKHNTFRHEMPYLLYLITHAMARREAEKQKKKGDE